MSHLLWDDWVCWMMAHGDPFARDTPEIGDIDDPNDEPLARCPTCWLLMDQCACDDEDGDPEA